MRNLLTRYCRRHPGSHGTICRAPPARMFDRRCPDFQVFYLSKFLVLRRIFNPSDSSHVLSKYSLFLITHSFGAARSSFTRLPPPLPHVKSRWILQHPSYQWRIIRETHPCRSAALNGHCTSKQYSGGLSCKLECGLSTFVAHAIAIH